jgi:hypothetical protein
MPLRRRSVTRQAFAAGCHDGLATGTVLESYTRLVERPESRTHSPDQAGPSVPAR